MAESSLQSKNKERQQQQQQLGSQIIPPLIAFPKTKSPSESNHSTNRQQQRQQQSKNVNNLLSHPSSPGMPSPAKSVAIKSDRVSQAGSSNGNTNNNLDGSEIRLLEIEGLWIVSSPNIVPYAQLQFMCDLHELNYDTVIEKYWKAAYKTRDLHTQEYMNSFYNDRMQQKQAGDRLKALFKQSSSTIPGVLACFLHNSEKQSAGELQLNVIDALQAREDDYLPQIIHNFSLIQQGNITQAFYTSLNNFMLFGFHTNNSLPPPIPRLNGFQLLLALFDCCGQTYAQQLNSLLKKDLYFSGEHLYKLVSFYTERGKQQSSTARLNYHNNHDNSSMIQSVNTGEDEADKADLLKILEGMLERIKKMKNNGIRNSVYLYYSFEGFYTKIHNKSTLLDGDNDDGNYSNAKMQLGEMQNFYSRQSKEHSSAEKEKLLENTPYAIHFYEEWMQVKTCILRQEPLTKKMEAIWVHAAFKELYYDAVQMLGEKSIIAEENTQIGLKCFGLLSDLGEKNSIHLHYSLLCYHGLYKEAAQLLGESKRSDLSSMQIQCAIRNSEIKQSLDKLRVLCLNRIEAYDFYLLTKCVFTQEERDFLGALCVLVVITSKSANRFLLFENLLIAKMLMRGTSFLPKNIVQSYVLLKALLKRGKFELMKDYICRLFIKKNLHRVLEVITPEQLKLAKGIVKQLCRKSNESKTNKKKKGGANPLLNPSRVVQNHSQSDEGVACFSVQFYTQLFQFTVKDIKRSILSKIEMLKSKSELQYVSSQLREYYNELITIGRNVLFMPEKGYSSGNLASNFDYFNAKNKQNIDIQALSLQTTDVQSLKQLIASQHVSRIFNLPNIQYKILKYFYAKKTAAIKDFISSSQHSSVQQQYQQQSSQEGSFELVQQEQLLHSPYYLKVQNQLEQIEERTECSLPMSFASQNNLSLQQPSQEGGDFKRTREQPSHQQSQQSQTQGYLMQNNSNISNNILIQEQNSGGEIGNNKQQQKQDQKEQPSKAKEEQLQQEGTFEGQNHKEQQQENHGVDDNNNYSLGSDAIINATTTPNEESSSFSSIISKYFSMQLDSDYAISIEGKLSQDEVLIFSEDDIIPPQQQGDQQQQQGQSYDQCAQQHQRIAMKFNPQSEYLLVRISSRDITNVLNGELANVISPFCLRHYGFLTRGEGAWYVLQEQFDDAIRLGIHLSFAQIHQLANIVNALQLADLTGIFAYYGVDLLFQRENNLYLSNIISVSQLVQVEYVGFDKESSQNQQSGGQLERQYAPELFSGSMNIDRAKSDVWMIGVILFHSIFQKPLVSTSPKSQQQQSTSNVESKSEKQQGNDVETQQDVYLKEVFKFKDQSHLKMILQKEKAAYYSNNSQDQKGDNYDDAETTQTGSSKEDNRKHAAAPAIIPTDIMEIYCKCLEMCLEFDPEMRCTGQELSQFLLQQLRASCRNEDAGDNLERLLEKKDQIILDLDTNQQQQQQHGLGNNNSNIKDNQEQNQQQQQDKQQQQQQQQTEWLCLTGGNTFIWVNMKDQLVFYRDENQNSIILYNPQLTRRKMKQSEVLTGIGVLIKQFKVESTNYHENNSNCDNSTSNHGGEHNSYQYEYYLCELKNGKTQSLEIHLDGRNISMQFEDNGLLDANTVTSLMEKEVLQQVKAAFKQQIESNDIILRPYLSESLQLNYLAMYQQLLTCLSSARKINSLQVDLFGREISGIAQGVRQQGVPLIMHSPGGKKCLFITENSCLIFERSTLSLMYFAPFLTHTNEGMQHASLTNILSSLFMKEQDYLSLFALPSLAYLGGYANNQFHQGVLLFKHVNQLTIMQHPQRFSPYMTTVSYSNTHFFDGHIFQGKYNGYGEYSNKKQMLYKGNFVENFLAEGTIYFDSHPQYLLYEGEVLYNKQTETYMMHGYGKCVLKNKTVFEGQFEMNQFSGKGKLMDKKKRAIYDGFWKGGLRDGPGVYQSKSNCFEGEYKKGQKSNYGKQVRKQGKEIYEGEFKNNKRNGIGVLRFPVSDGVVYFQGEFLEDKRHGEGIEITKSQQKFQVKYYKDQCIRRKQIHLSSQDYLFHFSNSKLKPLAADAEQINSINEVAENNNNNNNQEKDYEFIPLEREIQQGNQVNQIHESQQKLSSQNRNNDNDQNSQKKQQAVQDYEAQKQAGENNQNERNKPNEEGEDFYTFF